MSSTILEERSDDIVTLTLNRPAVFNAIDDVLAAELSERCRAHAVDGSVRAVIITGEGRGFCGGGDLKRLQELGADGTGEGFHRVAGLFHEAVYAIRCMDKAVIAAINGAAAGGGFSLALACDYRVISASAFMQLAYTSHGLSIDGGGTFTLPRLIGHSAALAIALMDERMDAERCRQVGLVHEVVAPDELRARAVELAQRFAAMPTTVIGRTKRLLNRSFDSSLEAQLEVERHELVRASLHPEGVEGMASFLERRQPAFKR